MEIQELENYKMEEWIETLELFQQNLIKDLLKEYSEEDAIDAWIHVTGTEYTATFGGSEKKDYLKNYKIEFDKFILEDDKYKDDIKELKTHAKITKFFIVAFLSNVLSKNLGVASSVIAPLIVLSLGLIGKIGLNAYKESIKKKNSSVDIE